MTYMLHNGVLQRNHLHIKISQENNIETGGEGTLVYFWKNYILANIFFPSLYIASFFQVTFLCSHGFYDLGSSRP